MSIDEEYSSLARLASIAGDDDDFPLLLLLINSLPR